LAYNTLVISIKTNNDKNQAKKKLPETGKLFVFRY